MYHTIKYNYINLLVASSEDEYRLSLVENIKGAGIRKKEQSKNREK